MKVVINRCHGGFSLSPLGLKRYAELKGKKCYFFDWNINPNDYKEITLEDAESHLSWTAFTVPNPSEVLPKEQRGEDGTYKDYNKAYKEISISAYDMERNNPHLIQVIEELGIKANSKCSELAIVDIPDDVEYTIDDYDGIEVIHEKHRSWC